MLSRARIHLPACSTIAWLYVYDCIYIFLYDNAPMMVSWRSQDHIQLVTTCNPQWLRMYDFMLVVCRRFINNVVNSRAELWTQRCATGTLAHYVFVLLFMGMRHIPVQHHCMVVCVCLYVYNCICMMYVYDCMTMWAWCHDDEHTTMYS